MKQSLFFLFALVLLTITSRAQITKGSVLLGGNFSVSASETEAGTDSKQNGFTISPVYGKATRENLIWGVEAGVGGTSSRNKQTGYKQSGNSYSLGVFVRKYKPVGKNGFYIFIQGKIAGDYNKNESRITPGNFKTFTDSKSIGLYVYPGISFAVSKRFHLESGFNNLLSLSYGANRVKENSVLVNKVSGINLSANLSNMASTFYLGFRFLIDKSKS